MDKNILLGLDISTTTIGIAIIKYTNNLSDAELIHLDYYKPNKKTDELNRLKEAKKYILEVVKAFNVNEVAVEEYIKFMNGASGASTTIPLAIINTILRLSIYEFVNVMPVVYNVLSIRHCLKLTKKLPAKEDMPEIVAKHLNIKYPYKYKINKKTKCQEIAPESYDMADAISVAIAHIIKKNLPVKNKKKAKKI